MKPSIKVLLLFWLLFAGNAHAFDFGKLEARLKKYVNRVGEWVASQSERPDLPWHFGVIQSDDVNAFAAPGGYIFVTLGLYRLLQNEADLAGVLGHEIGHVIRQHHLKILQQSKLVDLGGKALSKE